VVPRVGRSRWNYLRHLDVVSPPKRAGSALRSATSISTKNNDRILFHKQTQREILMRDRIISRKKKRRQGCPFET
jgi:hypothetical protein